MAMTALTFDVFWKDHGATRGMKDLGDNTDRARGRLDGFKVAAAAAGAAVGAAVFKFGKDSVDAFKESAAAQAKLSDAFTKFPGLADTSRSSLDKLNTALAKKTGIDDDATASGQAVLAQFKLTGEQVKQLTPLLQDYATKTGKDLPTAAQDLGKAILGQGRALKAVGIDFHDTGTAAGNFEQLVGGLTTQVGGFATEGLDPAALKSKILRDQFEELQEKVGGKLVPVLQKLSEVGIKVIDFIDRNGDVLGPLTIALGAATAAVWAFNIALAANPISLVILAIGALTAALVIAYQKSDTFRAVVDLAFRVVKTGIEAFWRSGQDIFNALRAGFQSAWEFAQTFARVLGLAWEGVRSAASAAWAWINSWVITPFKTALDIIKDKLDPIINAWDTIVSGGKKFLSFFGIGGTGGVGGLQSAFAGSSGRRFPLPGGRGAYRVTQGPHPNNAIDYAAPIGTPVFASFTGQLTTGDLGDRSYGKYFRLSGSGNPILGAHLSRLVRGSGPITQGSLIGYTGTSGNSTGPHFHLENFDIGGALLPGWNMVRNDTGRVENVRPVGAGGGPSVNITVQGSVVSERDLVRTVRDGLHRLERRGDV